MSGWLPPPFCALPWVHIACSVDGVWSRCCFDATTSYDDYYTAGERPTFRLAEGAVGCVDGSEFAKDNPERVLSPSSVLGSIEMRRTRREMLAGIQPDPCRHCFEVEDIGGKSHRQMMNEILGAKVDLQDLVRRTGPDGEVDWHPVSLELRLGNVCNLACIMCSFPVSSSLGRRARPQWTSAVIDPYSDAAEFWEDLESLSGVRYIYFAGGEPFLQPAHRRFLTQLSSSAHASRIELHYSSNLTVAPRRVLALFEKFRSVTVAASCDGLGETFETIRCGAKWSTFTTNLATFKQVAKVWLEVAVQKANVLHLADIVAFGRAEGLRVRLWNVVHYPVHLAITGLEGRERTRARSYLEQMRQQASHDEDTVLELELRSLIHLVS